MSPYDLTRGRIVYRYKKLKYYESKSFSEKKRTPDDKIVRRKGRVYIINKKNPKINKDKDKKDFKSKN
jgi:large subunit ribosomal protein L36